MVVRVVRQISGMTPGLRFCAQETFSRCRWVPCQGWGRRTAGYHSDTPRIGAIVTVARRSPPGRPSLSDLAKLRTGAEPAVVLAAELPVSFALNGSGGRRRILQHRHQRRNAVIPKVPSLITGRREILDPGMRAIEAGRPLPAAEASPGGCDRVAGTLKLAQKPPRATSAEAVGVRIATSIGRGKVFFHNRPARRRAYARLRRSTVPGIVVRGALRRWRRVA